MSRRPGSDIETAISEFRTQMSGDIARLQAAAAAYAKKGKSTKSLAEIIDSQKTDLAAIGATLAGMTARGDKDDRTKSVDRASTYLNDEIVKGCAVETIGDEYVEKLAHEGMKNPKDLDRNVSLSLTFFEPSLTFASASFTGLSVSISGVYVCLTGLDVTWAGMGVGSVLNEKNSAAIRGGTKGLLDKAMGLLNDVDAAARKLTLSAANEKVIANKFEALANKISLLDLHI